MEPNGAHHQRAKALACGLGLLAWVLIFQLPLWQRINGDDGTYALMARELIDGHLPYVSAWDNKPLGTYLAFAATERLFGPSLIGFKLLYAGTVFATAIGLFLIGKDGLCSRKAGAIAAFLYPAFTGNNDNTEIFVLLFLSLGFHQLSRALRPIAGLPPRLGPFLAAGLLFGLAVQFKYTAILEAGLGSAAAILFLWRLHAIRLLQISGLTLALGIMTLLPTLVAIAAYDAAGHLPDFLFANFLAPFRYVSQAAHVTPLLAIAHSAYGLLPLSVVGLVAIALLLRGAWRGAASQPAAFILAGWMLGAGIEVNTSGRYYQHYFLLLVPPLVLATASLIVEWRPHRQPRAIAAALAGLLLPPVVHYVQEARWIARGEPTPDDYRDLATDIRSRIRPGETLYVVNDNPMIYVQSGAASATRYAWPWHILRDDFGASVDADREISAIFARTPRYVVFRTTGAAYSSAESDRRLAFVRNAMVSHYRPVDARGGLTLFQRQ